MVKKVLLNLVTVICLIVFAVCAYQLIDYFYGNMKAESQFDKQRNMVSDTSELSKRIPKYEKMKAENDDFVGWIIADGTNVNYPMVQTVADPEYYLYRDFQKNKSKTGTIFISSVANLDAPTDVVVVFGHNMKDGTMFGSLRRYEDSQFLEKHNKIWVDTLKNRRQFEVTHVMKIRVDMKGQTDGFPYYQYSNFQNKEDYEQFIAQCNAHSIYNTGQTTRFGDKFVMLSTCEYTYSDGSGRLVVMGKEVKAENTDADGAPLIDADITKPMMGTYVLIGIAIAILIIIISFIGSFVKGRKRKARQSV